MSHTFFTLTLERVWKKNSTIFLFFLSLCTDVDAHFRRHVICHAAVSAFFYLVASSALTSRPLPAALLWKAMKHDVRRHGFPSVVERATRAASPNLTCMPDLGITLLQIPRDNTVNHVDRSATFLRRAFLHSHVQKKYACTAIFVTIVTGAPNSLTMYKAHDMRSMTDSLCQRDLGMILNLVYLRWRCYLDAMLTPTQI